MLKHYLKSDTTPRVEKSSTSRAFYAHDTGFYWASENALHEPFYHRAVAWSPNENAAAHCSALTKCLRPSTNPA